MKNEEILNNLASSASNSAIPTQKSNKKYTRAELLSAALYGIDELHLECVELLAKHSPFAKGSGFGSGLNGGF